MPEHYTKSTVSATFWCRKCGKPTLHRVDHGRRGPCYGCMQQLEAQATSRAAEMPAARQMGLFGGK